MKELDIESRWRQNSIYESCRVLIGKKAGGESCYLDIHERYHNRMAYLQALQVQGKVKYFRRLYCQWPSILVPKQLIFCL